MIKKVAFVFFMALISISLVMGYYFVKYKDIVNVKQNKLHGSFRPGKLGKYVNPFIGTGGYYYVCANNFPGATTPFGMVRLSPDTKSMLGNKTALNTSGYYYADNTILGFSHTRLSGTGATDGGHFRILPNTNDIDFTINERIESTFSHANEKAFPGYYAVQLDDGILAEFTATPRVGMHRYTFPKDSENNILINISSFLGDDYRNPTEGFLHINPENTEIEGHIRTYGTFAGRYGGQKTYFSAKFNQPFKSHQIWDGLQKLDLKEVKSDTLVVNLQFEQSLVELSLGISYVSIENARINRIKETDQKTFDQVVEQAINAWEDKLESITIQDATEEQNTIFYTALYRSFSMPTVFNDVNGQYLGFDNQVYKADSFTYYSDLSLWDTFRTLHPLYNIIARNEQKDMIVSLVKMAEQGGALPRWPAGNGYTGSMLGSPADMVISEAYQKGIRGFDVTKAYHFMRKTALRPAPKGANYSGRRGIKSYIELGYCAAEQMDKAIGKTLEYAWADDAISRLATELNKPEDARLFSDHSKYYKNVWNPETQFFQARNSDGEFVKKFDPLQLTYTDWDNEYTDDYVEGSALQWRYATPFDGQGLIGLFESKEYFISELNDFFELSDPKMSAWHPGSYYWHGNEPDIHAAYLFNEADRPDLTQKWVRWVLDNKYSTAYDGLDGNDDGATLSAWYIFSALGFYPQAGSSIYQLGAPLFKEASIKIDNEVLKIKTLNFAPENKYVNNIWLNGNLLKNQWFKHTDIADGGTLVFEMSKNPIR